MARNQAGWSNALSVFFLKKYDYFDKDLSYKGGTISWSYNGGEKSSVGIAVKKDNWGTLQERVCLNLHYTHTSNWDGEKSNMSFDVKLTTTPCGYGGKRYWFICPLSKNGVYCGRRVGVIYSIGKWFGCRHCGNIAYNSQFEGGRFRVGSVCEPDVEKAYGEIKRFYYNGKPTRRYKRYLRLREKMDNSWAKMIGKFGNVF
jgi:hypothetical protein